MKCKITIIVYVGTEEQLDIVADGLHEVLTKEANDFSMVGPEKIPENIEGNNKC